MKGGIEVMGRKMTIGQMEHEKLRKEFGERVEPALERLSLFLSQLFRGKFIRYV